jgi:2'-5' RNA ligase
MYEIKQQRTALVIPVLEAEPDIQAFRTEYIHTPAATMPPHITVYGPFIPMEQIDERLQNALTEFFASQPQFQFVLQRTGRFLEKDVLYLMPEPDKPFHTLRQAIQTEYPGAPKDFHPNRTMHLTIAQCRIKEIDEIEAAFFNQCRKNLPIKCTAKEIYLYEKHNGAWHKRLTFALVG